MTAFVRVSGAWHGAWCWERLVPVLEAAGHRAIAPDLLGSGGDRTPLPQVTLAAWADQIAAIVRGAGEQVVLVGHSRAGIIISEVAERVPAHVGALAYLAAFLVPDGGSIETVAAQVPSPQSAIRLMSAGDGVTVVRRETAHAAFYNLTEAEWAERAADRAGPEPMIAMATPLRLTPARFGSVPRAYIECLRDNAVPIELQRHMQAALPCSPVFTLETDHSPFYSAPDRLADCLMQLGQQYRPEPAADHGPAPVGPAAPVRP